MTKLPDFQKPNGGAGLTHDHIELHLGSDHLLKSDRARRAELMERIRFNWFQRLARGLYYGHRRRRNDQISRAVKRR